jgi:hypothetical protein
MIEFESTSYDARLEAYLDGVMADEERALFELEIQQNSQLAAEVALQARVDAALQREFPVVAIPAAHLAAFEKHLATASEGTEIIATSIRWPWVAGLVAAAAACLAFVLWNAEISSLHEPKFTPTPLAQVYLQTVAEGFEPYYECRDDKRFAETFELRQGIPLQLTDLPNGSMMKGLSYSGGLSRETTAMLCDVEGKPVMVFVDRAEQDKPLAAKNTDPNVNIFRQERDGLVFYEVTPLEKPTMMQHLLAEKM